MYTVETLKAYNNNKIHLGINEKTVEKINAVISTIESKNANIPQVGDIVKIKTLKGREYNNARISGKTENKVIVCTQPYIPYTSTGLSTDQSGGYFKTIKVNKSELKKIASEKREFWNFANGAGGDMGIHFKATVQIWEYTGDPDLFY